MNDPFLLKWKPIDARAKNRFREHAHGIGLVGDPSIKDPHGDGDILFKCMECDWVGWLRVKRV